MIRRCKYSRPKVRYGDARLEGRQCLEQDSVDVAISKTGARSSVHYNSKRR